MAESWVQHNGHPLDTGGADWLDVVSKGAGMVGNVANSPVGDAVATFGGPYGTMAVMAARGVAPAVEALTKHLGPAAATAATLSHPDPAVRAKAQPVIDAINHGAAAGDPAAHAARLNLTSTMVKFKDMLLAERAATIQALKDKLAEYGDPMSYAQTAGWDDVDSYGFGGTQAPSYEGANYDTGAPAGPSLAGLHAKLDRSLARATHEPQPTFKHRARG